MHQKKNSHSLLQLNFLTNLTVLLSAINPIKTASFRASWSGWKINFHQRQPVSSQSYKMRANKIAKSRLTAECVWDGEKRSEVYWNFSENVPISWILVKAKCIYSSWSKFRLPYFLFSFSRVFSFYLWLFYLRVSICL
jgi:hypothetical protein